MTGRLIVYTDGASRGNPGLAALGAVLYRETDDGLEVVESVSESIGIATNNEAEYRAVVAGLDAARRHGADEVELRADSQLLVRQLTGEYKVKSPGLKPLHARARKLLGEFARWRAVHVPREMNAEADALANAALDA